MQKYNVLIIGSGAAGYGTADWLRRFGVDNIAIVTENNKYGTSRNAGSDKQTYYKISLTDSDSAAKMADALSFGGGMHRDTALIEAANSARCFMRLVEYGVPFPTDKWGRYIGYKTDHDDASRATSAGPLTSKYMTECLEKRVCSDNEVNIIDGGTAVKIVTRDGCACGIICLIKSESGYELIPLAANYVVMATGGAANVYYHSAYPLSQSGALGLAVDAGCKMNNLTEWQYGIASTKVRWNLSGSYQQVIPAYYSVDENGNRYEFLADIFNSSANAYSNVFLKGYQWPFDSKRINGSSAIDLAVSEEIKKGRRVFMDFSRNPVGYDFDLLSGEARSYLSAAGAHKGKTPFERLVLLNPKAAEFYADKGINLESEPIEIAVCAQHMNGGIDVDCNWQTDICNLFAAGEAAGTFGIYRPGGSALNSTQVGGLRIAEYVSQNFHEEAADDAFFTEQVNKEYEYIKKCLCKKAASQIDFSGDMSRCAAHCRVYEEIFDLNRRLCNQLDKQYYHIKADTFSEVKRLYKYRDSLAAQACVCKAMLDALPFTGSRGGAVFYINGEISAENIAYREKAVVTKDNETAFVKLRSVPDLRYNFESVWQDFCRKRKI